MQNDDFSPILDQGDIDAPTGIKSRFIRRATMPVGAEAGVSRVLVSSHGVFLPEESQSTGERYWAHVQRWIKVDVSPHPLTFEIPLPDLDGRGEFIIKVTVIANVSDPATAAKQGIKQVRSYVEPALRMAVAAVTLDRTKRAEMPLPALRGDTSSAFTAQLAGHTLPNLPGGLTARVASVAVEFDRATSEHLAALAEQTRLGERVDAEAGVDAKRTGHDISKRDTWRQAIGDRLSDPRQRLIELAIADPTRENIAEVIDQANQLEATHRDSFVQLLTLMIEKDYVERDDPLYNAAVSLLYSMQSEAKIPMLGGVKPTAQLAESAEADERQTDWQAREE